jgi:hypothetical protein
MRAEIISVSNGTLAANKITMVRGDTLEVTLRVLRDDESPILINRFEDESHTGENMRLPTNPRNHRLSVEFVAALRDGGDVPLIYRSTQSTRHVIYGPTDELSIVLDHDSTRGLPAPLSLNFDMQITEFEAENVSRVSTVYRGMLQIERDFTTRYEVKVSESGSPDYPSMPA